MSARLSVKNFVDDATIFVVPDAVATLPVTNLQTPQRDDIWRSASIASQVIIGHWNGAGRKANCLGLFRHNGHGGQIRIVLYQDTALTTIAYDSGLIDLFDVVPLGSFEWGVDQLGLGPSDPFGAEAPFVHYFNDTAFAAFAVVLYGFGGSGSPYWEASRLWLGKYFEFAYNASDVALRPAEDTTQRRSRGASLRANRGERWHEMDLNFAFITEDDRPIVLDALKQAGLGQDVLLSVFPTSTGRKARDYTINGHLASLEPIQWIETRRTGRLTITEN